MGDDTAYRLDRVTFNPLKHIDLFGTILMPAVLLLVRSPVMFGYAKPVPVKSHALRHPRRDMVLVALAGPGINVALAIAAALLFHLVAFLPSEAAPFAQNLRNALLINSPGGIQHARLATAPAGCPATGERKASSTAQLSHGFNRVSCRPIGENVKPY
jgi:hypothetical protein